MTSERWRRIEEIYHAAAELDAAARKAFVAESCGDDSDLRREVDALLSVDPSKNDLLLNQPLVQGTGQEPTQTVLTPGARLGPYVIEGTLGAGGMGQVFRGRDTRLGRAVAIKITNVEFNNRFEREARSLSALNHPNVCTLYDVGPSYLVMELVEGQTLFARLKNGALPLELTVRYGSQIADALASAHALGIVHRDLKPGNIMIAKAGVKVLDFGLAKAAGDESLTGAFGVLGTPAYMAPEQRAGKPCDMRTDIYALGLILLEMATGDRTPEPRNLQPPQFAHVVERCLAPDPEDRWQSARDVKSELEWCLARPVDKGSRSAGSPLRWLSIGAAAAALLAIGIVRPWQGHQGPQTHAVRLAIGLPEEGASSDAGRTNGSPAVSPNGDTVILPLGSRADSALWMRRLDADRFERLNGTEGGVQPFWSPDGKQIGFFSDGKLKKMKIPGGIPETVCELNPPEPRGGAWSSRGVIVFGINYRGLFRVSENGGEPTAVAGLDPNIKENSLRFPEFLDDDSHFIYFSRTLDPKYHAIYIDSLDQVGKGKRRKVVAADGAGIIRHDPNSGADFLLFPKEDKLWAQTFNKRTEGVEGAKVAIADGVGQFTASSTGTLVFRKAGAERNSVAWYDRKGLMDGTVGQKGDYWDVQLSPDGERAAVINHQSSSGLFWIDVIELARNVQTPFTDFTGIAFGPVWARDSRNLYFGMFAQGMNRIAVKPINTTTAGVTLSTTKERYQPRDLSPDGKSLLADLVVNSTRQTLVSSPATDIQWRPVASPTGLTSKGQFSPDGHWVAYQSDETGTLEIYITDYPGLRQKKRISANGGMEARWRRDGRELYYLAASGGFMVVPIGASPLDAGKATELFKFHGRSDDLDAGFQYAPAADGRRFLMVNGDVGAGTRDLSVIFNWPEIATRK